MKLRADHMKLIELLTNPDDERSRVKKCEEAGFAGTYVYELLKNPDFQRALRETTDAELGAGRAEVLGAVKRKALSGDMKGAEIYLKATGDITGGTSVTTNVTQNANTDTEFADRLKGNHQDRRLAYERERIIPEDEG